VTRRRLRRVAPLSRPEATARRLTAGADTLYAGVVPNDLRTSVDCGCFHALPPTRRAGYVAEVARAVRPGGWLVLVTRIRPGDHPPDRPVFLAEDVLPEWGRTEADLPAIFAPAWAVRAVAPQAVRGAEALLQVLLERLGARGTGSATFESSLESGAARRSTVFSQQSTVDSRQSEAEGLLTSSS
jgi:SAM-dependent methyltransferase